MYPLKRNCNFQTETSFCAYKSHKFPCILGCKALFLSHKHNNDCNDEQTLIKEQNHQENVTSALNSAPAAPPFSTVDPHTSAKAKFTRSSSQSHLKKKCLVFCSVDGWQTTI